MKNQTFLNSLIPVALFLIILGSCSQHKEAINNNLVVVAGQITNPNTDSVWIEIEPAFGRSNINYGNKLDKNGSFNIHFEIEKPTPVIFHDGNEITRMFVNPGDSIYLTLDTKLFDETVKYSGKGADKNNFLAQKYLKLDDSLQIILWNMIDTVSPVEYKKFVDGKKRDYEKMFNDFTSQHNTSPEFIHFEKTEIAFQNGLNIYMYIDVKRDRSIGFDSVNIPMDFYNDFAKLANYKDPFKMSDSYNVYHNYYYPSYLAIINSDILNGKKGEERDSLLLSIYMNNLDGFEKERAVANFFYFRIDSYKVDFFEKNKTLFNKNVKDKSLRNFVLTKYDEVKKQLAMEMPDGAHLVNLNTKEYVNTSFNDIIAKYKGKVIYLDFWASWCGPCKGEMPYSLKMQEYFKGKDVAFVYISSDRDSLAWKKMVKILQITGDHYLASRKVRQEYNELYNVRYIPRYVIIDKTGKTVDENAKRPSDNKVREDIEKLF